MSADLRITGIKELDRRLRSLASENGVASVKKHMRKATRKSVKSIILPDAKRRAPVLTGLTRRAMTVRAASQLGEKRREGKRLKDRSVIGHKVIIKGEPFAGGFFYPAVHEFGSKKMNIKPLKFLRYATYRNESRVQAKFVGALRTAINKAAHA